MCKWSFVFLYLLVLPFSLCAQERITRFDAAIVVDLNGGLTVTETIHVVSEGLEIKRGIFRTLPLRRKGTDGEMHKVKLSGIRVRHNGNDAPFAEETEDDHLTLRIGEADVLLDPGRHRYEIEYHVPHQVFAFEGYDELYWNVTGNDWSFSIDSVTAAVTLPSAVSIMQQSCYTGGFGSTERECTASKNNDQYIRFEGSGLGAGEGLTIAVGFTPGMVAQPPPPTLLNRWGGLLIGYLLLGLYGGLLYYLWRRHGVDPPAPVTIPQLHPPDGFSPAAVGMFHHDGYNATLLSVSLLSLAVKGYLRIEEKEESGLFTKSTHYELCRLKEPDTSLPREEHGLMAQLFYASQRKLISGSYDPVVESTVGAHRAALHWVNEPLTKEKNRSLLILPGCGCVVMLIAAFILMGAFALNDVARLGFVVMGLLAVAASAVFAWNIRKPSTHTLAYKAQVEGFRWYLGAAEEKILQSLNPPHITPQHFEALLPFAIALGVDEVWGARFSNVLQQSGVQEHQPSWYTGRQFSSRNISLFSSSFGDAVSASSTKPSSSGGGSGSSGSSGGGSSGGGGGGGGGGGW